jgi:NAD(P)-dependent dehydrogenase (short-subunit alcohol dehydrogenase family)
MDITGRRILLLGGAGLVGMAIARRMIPLAPARLVIGSLREDETRGALAALAKLPGADAVEIVPAWGDIFLRSSRIDSSRRELVRTPEGRREILEDLFGEVGPLDTERYGLVSLIVGQRPEIIVDCVNTATAIAYRDVFTAADRLRRMAAKSETVPSEDVEQLLTVLYLPQLIDHVRMMLNGMRRADTKLYLKVGTSGTGGMGLNIPFTHSEERPSRTLLAKASVAGAHSLLLYLMARTPDAPAVKEIKPTAAIAWKRIAYGPVMRRGEPMVRWDSTTALPLDEAFNGQTPEVFEKIGDIESVYLDAGENGLFSAAEFEAISALGMMEFVTPEEIAEAVIAEIEGRPTGREIVSALDASSYGPTYRAGVMRDAALQRLEALEREHGVHSVAFEMLGPPRLAKLLFEAAILGRLYDSVAAASELEPEDTACRAQETLMGDAILRSDILSVGLPILLPDGKSLLRGPDVEVQPEKGSGPDDPRWRHRGWVDLTPASWVRWRERCRSFLDTEVDLAGADAGSQEDLDVRSLYGKIRPGALAAHVFRDEDEGIRVKR